MRLEFLLNSSTASLTSSEPQKSGQARLPATKLTNTMQAYKEEDHWEEVQHETS